MKLPIALLLFVILGGCSSGTSSTSTPLVGGLNTVVGTNVTRAGDSTYGRIIAQFWQDDGRTLRGVDTVKMNGVSVPYSALNRYYIFDSTALPNDGTLQWHIVGQNGIAAFDQSIIGPAHLRITSPAPGDTVSRGAGFTIKWDAPISGGTVSVAVDDSSASPPTISNIGDNGVISVQPSQISAARYGRVWLYVYRETIVSQVFSGKLYQFDAQSQSKVEVYLKP